MRRVGRLWAVLAISGLAAVGSASADTVQLTDSFGGVGLTAYKGRVVWSQLDPSSQSWRLWQWHAGVVSRLRAKGRDVPFDADIGPDRSGRPVLVYSRCLIEPTAPPSGTAPSPDWAGARGCHIYELALTGGGRERRIRSLVRPHASDTTPTIWRGRIAFSRYVWHGRTRQDYPRLLLARSDGRLRRLPTGSVPRVGRRPNPRGAVVAAADLNASQVALLWWITGSNLTGLGTGWEVWSDPLAKRHRLVDSGEPSGTCGSTAPWFPNANGTHLIYLRYVFFCDGEGPDTAQFIDAPPRSRQAKATTPDGWPASMARDGATTYWVRAPQDWSDHDCAQTSTQCALIQSTNLPSKPITLSPGSVTG